MDVHGHRRIDRWITSTLRIGMVASISVMIFGILLYVVIPQQASAAFDLSTFPDEILKGNAVAVLNVGILILIATPLSRVLTALAVFVIDREAKFIAICVLVVLVLLAAVLLRI